MVAIASEEPRASGLAKDATTELTDTTSRSVVPSSSGSSASKVSSIRTDDPSSQTSVSANLAFEGGAGPGPGADRRYVGGAPDEVARRPGQRPSGSTTHSGSSNSPTMRMST